MIVFAVAACFALTVPCTAAWSWSCRPHRWGKIVAVAATPPSASARTLAVVEQSPPVCTNREGTSLGSGASHSGAGNPSTGPSFDPRTTQAQQ
jgi:hypothetical protein